MRNYFYLDVNAVHGIPQGSGDRRRLAVGGGLGIVESTVGVTEGLLEMDDSLLFNVLTCSEVECKDSPLLLIESGGLSQHITKCESRFLHARAQLYDPVHIHASRR